MEGCFVGNLPITVVSRGLAESVSGGLVLHLPEQVCYNLGMQ